MFGYLAVSLPPMLLAADLFTAVARGWRIGSRLDTALLWLSVGWLVAMTALSAVPLGRRWYARWCGQLILLSGSLGVAWLAVELMLGPVLAVVLEPFHCRRPGLDFVYRPTPGVMRDVSSEAHVHFNTWGVRGDDPPPRADAARILCVGGSTTLCTYLDNAKTWPHLLGQDLSADAAPKKTWVGNVGMASFTSADHLQFIEQSPLVDEMDCLIVQVGVNDFMSCIAGPRPEPLWARSRVRKLLRSLANQYAESSIEIEDTAGQVYQRRRALRAAAAIDRDPPDLGQGLREYADDIRAIVDACRSRGVRVVFTTQPVLWKADLDSENERLLWFGQLPDGRYLSVDQLRGGMDRYNETLAQICRECGVELVDLRQLNGDPAIFYDDCHFTETGARQVAAVVAHHFLEHPLQGSADR
jgi:lysophospholipase L1-like esterase